MDDTNGQTNFSVSQPEFGYYAELAECIEKKGTGALKQRIKDILIRLGFNDYSFINAKRADIIQTALNTYPSELLQAYKDNDLFAHDMIIQCALNQTKPFLSSALHAYVNRAPFTTCMTKCMKNIAVLHKEYGFNDAYHVPVSITVDKCQHLFLFTATIRGETPMDFIKKTSAACTSLVLLAEAIAHTVTTRASDLLPKNKRRYAKIKPKPLHILDALANSDMTIAEIADKLCVTSTTVSVNLNLAKKALNVKTNYAAIRRAINFNLIDFKSTDFFN